VRSLASTFVVLVLLLIAGVGTGCSSSSSDKSDAKPAKEIVYVALGDSYSSGEGAPPYHDDAANPKSCQRSDLGWPSLLAKQVKRVISFTQVACSSATTAYMTGPWTSRKLPAQIAGAPDPKVTLVTFTVGGNDMGFGGIVANCFLLDCSGIPTNGLFTSGLQQLGDHLTTSVYPALRAAYPNARIVQVGYPRLTPAAGQKIKDCGWLSTEEQAAAADLVRLIDTTIRTAARASSSSGGAKVQYLDVTNALAGHELCSSSPWINPVGINAQAAAHPTAAGQRAIERAVVRGLALD
jgi:lysophospholipase L1-like esterase